MLWLSQTLDKPYRNFLMTNKQLDPGKVAFKITIIYMILGILWILVSDTTLGFLVSNKKITIDISMIKGWLYVLLTGGVIFGLTYSAFKRVEAAEIAFDSSNDGVWYWDVKNSIQYFSDRCLEMSGYSREEIEKMGAWHNLIHPDDVSYVYRKILEHQEMKTSFYLCEYRIKGKNGKYKWIQERGKTLLDQNGQVYSMTGSCTDIEELKRYQNELEYLADYDRLTGLGNKILLDRELNQFLAKRGGQKYALLYIGSDNFKYINDTLGHACGDEVIIAISQRLSSLIENNCEIYKSVGDEFIILVKDFDSLDEVELLAKKIMQGFKLPFGIRSTTLYITASIGIAVYPEHGFTLDEILKNAYIAMFKAKDGGKDKFVLYSPIMNEVIVERMKIEKNLRTALENKEFELHYQPQLNLRTGRIDGFEALLRWRNPELGCVPPLKFIKIAEENNFIISLGEWVLREACSFLKKLHLEGYTNCTMAINVCILELLEDNFVEGVIKTLGDMDLETKYLEIEITESILIESIEQFKEIGEKLDKLRRQGVRIALDDFGKGYSSLSYLKQLPITTLKIDKNFVDNISLGGKNSSLIDSIIMIGHKLDLCIIAEGVEKDEQLVYLIENNCDRMQGYLFSKPIPEEQAMDLLNRRRENRESSRDRKIN